MARDLRLIGVESPQQLAGQNAFDLHEKLCAATGKTHDPCVIDVFMSAIDFMEGGDPAPWYFFTPKRKELSGG